MKEIFTMWRHTQMVVLVALSAAIYAAVLIPFKGFTIIPGFTEVRPANVFPFVFGLLFGPAGAWGAAVGNLIGDRKSTRLNSSHANISYAVFCLKKKKQCHIP